MCRPNIVEQLGLTSGENERFDNPARSRLLASLLVDGFEDSGRQGKPYRGYFDHLGSSVA